MKGQCGKPVAAGFAGWSQGDPLRASKVLALKLVELPVPRLCLMTLC
jgi:hypothetical protein